MKLYLKILLSLFFLISYHISLAANDNIITISGTDTVSECTLTEIGKSFSISFWAEGCPYPTKASLLSALLSKPEYSSSPSCNTPTEPLPSPMPPKLGLQLDQPVPTGYEFVDKNITEVKSMALGSVYTNLRDLHGYCQSMSAGFSWVADEHSNVIEATYFTNTYKKTCTSPDTNFQSPASNEEALFTWTDDNNRSNECTQTHLGRVQDRIQDCKPEYRCLIDVEEDKDTCRKQSVASYVLPTAGVFHEDIALIGTEIGLHYQSEYLSNDTIANGWSLDVHHILDNDYLHLGSGKFLNIKSYKSVENNITTVTLGNESYIFDENNLHIATKDNYTKKTLYTFTYNANNKLISITDAFNNTTTLQRDTNDILTSVTAAHGQVSYIYLDDNSDLVNVSYEDNSNYTFSYENHLMLSEIEPNGNKFLHQFDANGRVVKIIDAEQGIWGFSSTKNDNYTVTKVTKADGDEVTYKDYFLDNNSLVTQTTIASGDMFSSSSSVDGTSSSSDRCGVTRTINYQIDKDPVTNKRVPKSVTVKTPNELTSITNYSQNYIYDSDNTLVKKEISIERNGATTTRVRDYELSKATITSPEGRVSTIVYNEDTLLPIKIKIADLKPIIYKYDDEGRVKKIQQGHRKTKFVYDSRGNVEKKIDRHKHKTTSYAYDLKDRVTQILYPDGHSVNFAYDKNGNMIKLTTPTLADHQLEYNGVNKRTSLTSPLGYKTFYSYDKQRRATKITRASGKTIKNAYDKGRLLSVTTNDGLTEYGYACGDKVASITKGTQSILYSYDGELPTQVQIQGVLNQTIKATYNNNFQVTSLEYAGLTTEYAYDKDGLLTNSAEYVLTRDKRNGEVTKISNGIIEIGQKSNKYGELKAQTSQNFKLELKRKDGKIVRKREILLSPKQISHHEHNSKQCKTEKREKSIDEYRYTYDKMNRLVKVKKGHRVVERYTYDANSNRVKAKVYGVTTQAYYTLDDQVEVYGDNTYKYDADGYLIEKTTPNETTTYTYNTLGTLTDVVTPTTNIHYHLNPLNQRVAKEVNGVIVEKYLWRDLTTLLAVYDTNNTLVQRFNYADNRMPISMTQNKQTYYLHYDQVGTLRAVTDINHNIIKEITYDTFGNILQDTNKNFKVPFGFAGGLADRDTKLVHFGYREYDPYTGKWTAKDPIDFNGGDSNLYGYVLGDPVGFIDPSGLAGMSEIGVGIGLFFAGKKWYDAIDNLHDKAEMTKLCRRVYDQLDYDRSQINNSCMSDEDKLDLLRKSAESEKELFKVCSAYLGIGK